MKVSKCVIFNYFKYIRNLFSRLIFRNLSISFILTTVAEQKLNLPEIQLMWYWEHWVLRLIHFVFKINPLMFTLITVFNKKRLIRDDYVWTRSRCATGKQIEAHSNCDYRRTEILPPEFASIGKPATSWSVYATSLNSLCHSISLHKSSAGRWLSDALQWSPG